MNRATIGWSWVLGQAILLGALILLPGRSDWPTPSLLTAAAWALILGGLIIVALAAFGLGSALTPTPMPTQSGSLSTNGLYQYVRHPIYSGVLLAVAGVTLRSGSWIHLVIAVATVLFFDRKARWEEGQLVEHYEGYRAYAAGTPRFVPIPFSQIRRRFR